MKGNNDLHLNEATVIEALQEYLTKRMPTTPLVVKGIDKDRSTGNSYASTFVVKLECPASALMPAPGVT